MRTYVRDPLYFKLYVVLLLLMDTMHSVNVMIICYEGLVSNYFRPEQLLKSSWGFNVLPVVTGVVIILCQGFFAYRIYKVYQRWKVPIALFVISVLLAELGFCIASCVKGFQSATWFEYEKDTWMISAALCIALVLDTILTVILIVFLRYNRGGFAKTNSKLDTLIAYAICTGLLTDVLNALGFAFAQSAPGNMWYAALNMEVAKVYTNSVLAALNFRNPKTYSESNTNFSNPISSTMVTIELAPLPKTHNRNAAAAPVSHRFDESVIDIKDVEDGTKGARLATRSQSSES
ncbi:hypothetical protein OH76DRAFT_1411208 [Lentinus brumalis]|uniref:DUF6534 domain-containing protein n=1 Tax=Lentinus brumalis TaxID=2498619 RepID=A0A371CPW9_9APHY|nr:hypothetical protein OH76DRAFT_1411208 [Polyporus brumalis]